MLNWHNNLKSPTINVLEIVVGFIELEKEVASLARMKLNVQI